MVAWPSESLDASEGFLCAELEVNAGEAFDINGDSTFELMVDSGANVGVTGDLSLLEPGIDTGTRSLRIKGMAGSAVSQKECRLGYTLPSHQGPNIHGNLSMAHISTATRNILPESKLVEDRLTIVKGPAGCFITSVPIEPPVDQDESVVHLIPRNGLYFVEAAITKPSDEDMAMQAIAPECNVVLPAVRRAQLWAARLHASAETLSSARRNTPGGDIPSVTPEVREKLELDRAKAASNVRRRKVPRHTEPSKRAAEPGERWILDGSGPFNVPSIIDGCTYELSAVCEETGLGIVKAVKQHTIDAWVDFVGEVMRVSKKHRHTARAVRFDRAPELRSDVLKKRIESSHDIVVELAPRNHHEGVGAAEVMNDLRARVAEAMLRRCERGQSYLLAARAYAQVLINCCARLSQSKTRVEHFTGGFLNLAQRVPYLFGTWVVILEEEGVRGPKGAPSPGRSSQGELLGIDGPAYIVRKENGSIVRQRHVTPIDELRLLDRGLAPSTTQRDASMQTDDSPPEPPAPPKPKPPPVVHPPRPPDHDVIGKRIEVFWPRFGGYFGAKVTEYVTKPTTGKQHYHVLYDNPGQRWLQQDVDRWHELGDNGVKWRLEADPSDQVKAKSSSVKRTVSKPVQPQDENADAARQPARYNLRSALQDITATNQPAPTKPQLHATAEPPSSKPQGATPPYNLRDRTAMPCNAGPMEALVPSVMLAECSSVDQANDVFEAAAFQLHHEEYEVCLLYTSPSPRDS